MDENLKETLKVMVDSYKALNQAKDDCKVVVDSAFSVYEQNEGEFNKKYLTKIAKAIANQKLDVVEDETENNAKILTMILELKE